MDLTAVLKALGVDLNQTIALVVVGIVLGLWAQYGPGVKQWITAHLNARQYAQVIAIAKNAVSAAEQSGLVADINGVVQDKKAFAINLAQSWLDKYKIPVDAKTLDAVIESQVYENINHPSLLGNIVANPEPETPAKP